MSEEQVVRVRRRRRSRGEAEQLVDAFEASGLTRREFSQRRGVAVWTLDYYRKRRRMRASEAGSCGPLLAVEVAAGERETEGGSTLAVVLSRGRRIEVPRGFDAGALERLIGVLERL